MSKTNIIDIKPLLKKKSKNTVPKNAKNGALLDFVEKRQAIISQERRQTKRTILTEFVGAFIVLPKQGLQKVDLYDISETGLAFDLAKQFGQMKSGEEIAVRIYLSHKNYFGFTAKIANVRFIQDEDLYRHGCQIVSESYNQEALYHFVKFIESVSMNIKVDAGDLITSGSKK